MIASRNYDCFNGSCLTSCKHSDIIWYCKNCNQNYGEYAIGNKCLKCNNELIPKCPFCNDNVLVDALLSLNSGNIYSVVGSPFSGKTLFLKTFALLSSNSFYSADHFNAKSRKFLFEYEELSSTSHISELPPATILLSPPIFIRHKKGHHDYWRLFYEIPAIFFNKAFPAEFEELFRRTTTLILMFDPFNMPGLVEKNALPLKPYHMRKRQLQPSTGFISNSIQYFLSQTQDFEKQFDIQIIVIISKADVLRYSTIFHPDKKIRTLCEEAYRSSRGQIPAQSDKIRELFLLVAADEDVFSLNKLEISCRKPIKYFPFSALMIPPFISNHQTETDSQRLLYHSRKLNHSAAIPIIMNLAP